MKSKITADQETLFRLMSNPIPGAALPAPKSAVVAGKTFEVSYHIAARKCYDNLPTPTLMIKVDGKRTSRAAAFDMLA